MNYTKPDDKDHVDSYSDLLFCSLIFSAALGTVLKEGEGIFIKLKGDELELEPDVKHVIVWNSGTRISIMDASERDDLEEGDRIQMIDLKNITN